MSTIELHARAFGAGGTPLILCHGLLGSSRNWQALAKAWGRTRRVCAVDLRNHGASPHDGAMNYPSMAADLEALIDKEGGVADVLGHSMGGKAAMALALRSPAHVRRLIVADIAPIAYDHGFADYVEALAALDLTRITRRSEADAALEEKVPDPAIRAFLLQNLGVGAGDRPVMKPNLDVLRRCMDAITGWPKALDGLEPYPGPTLFVRGGASDYVAEDGIAAARRLFSNVQVETIEGAGHWLHAEAPKAFTAVVDAFLAD